MDTFADRKLEDNSKLEKHREFLHGLINDFNLQIHGTDLGYSHANSCKLICI